MNAEARYEQLKTRIIGTAMTVARNASAEVRQEVRSIANLAFVKAIANAHACKGDLDGWIVQQVRGDVLDAMRVNRRYRLRVREYSPTCSLIAYKPKVLPPGLSRDAVEVATAILAEYHGDIRTVMERVRTVLYQTMGWRRFWSALDEIKTELES